MRITWEGNIKVWERPTLTVQWERIGGLKYRYWFVNKYVKWGPFYG